MTPTLMLQISAVIAFLFAVGHTLGGRKRWSPMGENAVLKAMAEVRFDTMGANRSPLKTKSRTGFPVRLTSRPLVSART